jgi:hypothetical protein
VRAGKQVKGGLRGHFPPFFFKRKKKKKKKKILNLFKKTGGKFTPGQTTILV